MHNQHKKTYCFSWLPGGALLPEFPDVAHDSDFPPLSRAHSRLEGARGAHEGDAVGGESIVLWAGHLPHGGIHLQQTIKVGPWNVTISTCSCLKFIAVL